MTTLEWFGVADNAFLIAFPSLFSIINPIGGALIFDIFTRGFPAAERSAAATRIGLYSLLIMFGALWAGATVLAFFGVSIEALRVAGGLVVAASGWRLLAQPGEPRKEGPSHQDRDAKDAAKGDLMQLAFFPLTLPFTTGPGTIAVAITLGAVRPRYGFGLLAFFAGASLAAAVNAVIICIAYRFAERLIAFIGTTAREVVIKLSAFLLMCIGIQILLSAVGDVVKAWSTSGTL